MNVVVLAGGLSPERDVSLASGMLISNALVEKGHSVLLLDLYKGIKDDEMHLLFSNEKRNYDFTIDEEIPELTKKNTKNLIGRNVIKICKMADIVFLALHGSIGENGKLQAIFDCMGIKYTGSSYEGSILAMDKILTKKILEHDNIKTPKWHLLKNVRKENIKFPVVVKPANNGSSIGVSIANNLEEFEVAIIECEKYKDEIIIEEYIKGREFSVGILDKTALPPIEIIPKAGFYDYKNKYQEGKTIEICPPKISQDKIKEMQQIAMKVHNALLLGAYSRIDFILDENGNLNVLEANSLPGMTKTSLLPQEALVTGITYEDLCEKILLSNLK